MNILIVLLQPHLEKSIGEELAMDDEDILRRVITRTRKMKKMEDKEEARGEEENGREISF